MRGWLLIGLLLVMMLTGTVGFVGPVQSAPAEEADAEELAPALPQAEAERKAPEWPAARVYLRAFPPASVVAPPVPRSGAPPPAPEHASNFRRACPSPFACRLPFALPATSPCFRGWFTLLHTAAVASQTARFGPFVCALTTTARVEFHRDRVLSLPPARAHAGGFLQHEEDTAPA